MIRLVIADENESYIKALAQYLQVEHGQAFEIACFTQGRVLQEHLVSCAGIDMLLIDQKLLAEINVVAIKIVILFTETMLDCNGTTIYKYQRADQIAKLLLGAVDKFSDGRVNIIKSNKESRLICVYSPGGATGKSTIAYNLAHQYAMHAQKVLFLSLEAFSTLSFFQRSESARGLIFMLYLIKNKHPNLQLKLNTIKAIDGNTNIHYLERESNVLEYKDIKLEDMELLTDFLKKQSSYDAIIIDLDSAINEISLGAFKYCDVIINILCNSPYSTAKQEDFIEQSPKMDDFLQVELSRKTIHCHNQYKAEADMKFDEGNHSSGQLEIPYINNLNLNQGGYYPEMSYFKQLYDRLENFLSMKVMADERNKE